MNSLKRQTNLQALISPSLRESSYLLYKILAYTVIVYGCSKPNYFGSLHLDTGYLGTYLRRMLPCTISCAQTFRTAAYFATLSTLPVIVDIPVYIHQNAAGFAGGWSEGVCMVVSETIAALGNLCLRWIALVLAAGTFIESLKWACLAPHPFVPIGCGVMIVSIYTIWHATAMLKQPKILSSVPKAEEANMSRLLKLHVARMLDYHPSTSIIVLVYIFFFASETTKDCQETCSEYVIVAILLIQATYFEFHGIMTPSISLETSAHHGEKIYMSRTGWRGFEVRETSTKVEDPLLKGYTGPNQNKPKTRAVPRRPPGPTPTTPIEIEISRGEVLYSRTLRTIIKLESGRVVKYGLCIRPEEAKIMKYIQSHTRIPLPGNVEFVSENGKSYLYMDHIDGEPLDVAWRNLQKHERMNVLNELKDYMDQLRALRPDGPDGEEPDYIGSLDRGPCADRRVVGAYDCGPFDTEREFNDHVVANLRDSIQERYRRFIRGMMKDDHRMCFTHGDLHPGNIMIKDGHVAALLDWEMAGWYPEYWEWCKSLWNEKWNMADWSDSRHLWLQPYEYEYAVDRLLISQSSPCW